MRTQQKSGCALSRHQELPCVDTCPPDADDGCGRSVKADPAACCTIRYHFCLRNRGGAGTLRFCRCSVCGDRPSAVCACHSPRGTCLLPWFLLLLSGRGLLLRLSTVSAGVDLRLLCSPADSPPLSLLCCPLSWVSAPGACALLACPITTSGTPGIPGSSSVFSRGLSSFCGQKAFAH